MGFVYNEIKRAPKTEAPNRRAAPSSGKARDIPIQALNRMGCEVCPRDKEAEQLLSPKMEPDGPENPLIYLLGSAPTPEEDEANRHWVGKVGRAIKGQFGDAIWLDIRKNHITQCMGPQDFPDSVEIECCRRRIVADIEQTRPLVVVGVGDAPLQWATGLARNALAFRGTLIATRIGRHACWYYPLIYPNYALKEKRNYDRKSEYELAMEHDVDRLLALLDRGELEEAPKLYLGPYDQGIERITGQEPGDFQRLEEGFHRLLKLPVLGLDLETSGLSPYTRDPHIWTAAAGSFEDTISFAIDHPDGWGSEAQMRRVRGAFGSFIRESGRKVCHHAGMEQLWIGYEYGHKLLRQTEWEDTMLLWHSLDERDGTRSLDVQCRIHFGFFLKAQSRVDVSHPDWIKLYTIEEVLRYNGMDTKWTDLLYRKLKPKVDHVEVFRMDYERKMRTTPTLVGIQHKGLPVDVEAAEEMIEVFRDKIQDIEEKLRRCPEIKEYTKRFGSFDPGNSHHVLKLLQVVCKRDEIYVEERGETRTTGDEIALKRIPAKEVPSAPLILEHREASKVESTYLSPVTERKIVAPDGIIHAPYSLVDAVTGRLSSPMHNWPKRKNREVRGVVRTRKQKPSSLFLACDYGQIEFRVAGMLTGDEAIIKACWTDYDVHKFWAERLIAIYPAIIDQTVEEFHIDWDEKGLKTLRQEMKNKWVFPQIFGSAIRSCAENLGVPLNIMEELADEFWDTFSATKTWQETILKLYEKHLHVETLSGRRRRGPMTKNQIINHPIQGTALDIVTAAMDALSEISIAEEDPDYQCNFNGHDDLTFMIADDVIERKAERIVKEMCRIRFDYINVPIVVEASIGWRWDQLEEIGKYRSDKLFNHRNPYG